MARVSLSNITAARRDPGKLWLPALTFDYMKRDLSICERAYNSGYAAFGDVSTTPMPFYIKFPSDWGAALDLTLLSGLVLKFNFQCEARRALGTAGANPTMHIEVDSDIQDSRTVTLNSWVWTNFTYTWSTALPTGLKLIEIGGTVDDDKFPQARRGTVDDTPASRASMQLYFDDGT